MLCGVMALRADVWQQTTRDPMLAEPDTHAPTKALSVKDRDDVQKVDARGAALVTLAILAVLFSLQLSAKFVIPLVVSVLLAYALNPIVYLLERRHIPRVIGAFLVLTTFVGCCGFGIYELRGQAESIVGQIPDVVARASHSLESFASTGNSSLGSVRRAAEAVQAAAEGADVTPAKPGAPQVVIEKPSLRVKDVVMAGGLEIMEVMGQAAMVIFLVFFLLIAGDKFKRKFVKVAGRTLSEKKITVQMFDEINRTVQRYLVMLLVTNCCLGLLTWLAFHFLGLQNAGTWALLAAVLHLIPYFGPLLVAVATGIAAFTQFGTFGMAFLVGGFSLIIAAFIGTLLTTWMTGRLARMNTVAVFLSLLLFGTIWGVWGALLSVPIAVIIKVVSDHIEGLEAFSEFLGE
jgi:predicted PurR-regulated permease PerM